MAPPLKVEKAAIRPFCIWSIPKFNRLFI